MEATKSNVRDDSPHSDHSLEAFQLNERKGINTKIKKMTFEELEDEINDTYYDENHKSSSSLDILSELFEGAKNNLYGVQILL